MDKCPFCDYEIEPEDATFKKIAKHIAGTHEYVPLERFVDFLYQSESPRYFIRELSEAIDERKTSIWWNS